MTVTLGIGTYAYAWSIGVPGYEQPAQPMRYHDFLETASDLKLTTVQIADNLPLDKLSTLERQALQATANKHGMTIEVGTRGITPPYLQHYIQIAAEMESPILRVVVDSDNHHPDVPEIIEILQGALPDLQEHNIILAIENHDRFRATHLVEVMQALDSSHIGICLDTVNSFGALEGPAVVVEQLGPYVVNLHVKDFEIRRVDHNMGFVLEGTPAGHGMLDVPWLLAELDQYGRDYSAIIELWPAPEPDMVATITKEQQWARQSVETLRQWIKE